MDLVADAIREELRRHGWAQADLAHVLGWPVQTISEIMKGRRRIDAPMALDLAEVSSDKPAADWLALQNAVDLDDALRRQAGSDRQKQIEQRAELEHRVPVRELIRRGVVSRSDPAIQAKEVAALIGDDPTFGASAKRQVTESPFTRAQTAWIALARQKAMATVLPPYKEEDFAAVTRALPKLVTTPTSFDRLPATFAALGVALVHVDPFPGGRIDGVSLALGENPMIALSGRGKRFDKVFFALLHECAHIIEGHWRDAPRLHEDGKELTVGDSSIEDHVNALAADWCFAGGLHIERPISGHDVASLAAKHGVAKALVIGNLQHNKIIEWSSALSRGLPTVEEDLKSWT